MRDFLEWLRYVEYDGDMSALYLLKNESLIEAQKIKEANKNRGDESSDDADVLDSFKGYLKPMNIALEKKVLNKIVSLCKRSLSFYDTTLKEDTAMLEDETRELTGNERNCVLYRQGEKVILHFLIDSCLKFVGLLSMSSSKEVRKEINKYKNFDGCMEYVKLIIYPMTDGQFGR